MADISSKMYERNGIERIVVNDGRLWSNEKYIEGGIDHKNNIIQIIGNIDKNYKNGQNV